MCLPKLSSERNALSPVTGFCPYSETQDYECYMDNKTMPVRTYDSNLINICRIITEILATSQSTPASN